ncbi:MAG: DUF3034 family protein [Xanthomonadales bacterium]|nr:DUF3034 family protein [Xanthomonadales bacterium]MBK7146956.1 DUF3034 family protein [Xanthomonadales bacterium]MCC6562731.1 DUF3034 family protein [Xanthomonadales bacterium]
MLRQSVVCLAALIALVGPARAEDEGRLAATGGLVGIEAAAGGGLVPWAVLAGLSTKPGFDLVAGSSLTVLDDFRLESIGLSASWNDRFELSLGRQQFDIDEGLLPPGFDRHLRQTVLGAKLRIAGDLIYGSTPQLALGLQYKRNDDDVLARALGAQRDHDVEAYLSATRLFLDGPFDRNWLLNATLRATRANETGLLGFGSADRSGYELVGEVSAAMFFRPELALGFEYRQKPDGLPGLGESDWRDLFLAWFPSRRISLALAFVDLGHIAARPGQNGVFVSINGNW